MPADRHAEELAFLGRFTPIHQLQSADGAVVAVAPAYQGRVMTSGLDGPGGASFGWLNRRFIEAGRQGTSFDNYGGEDRFWLGPEGGQFSVFFAAGDPQDLAHWQTPEGFNQGSFAVDSADTQAVRMHKDFAVTNASGTRFDCHVERTIRLLDRPPVQQNLRQAIPAAVRLVAFETDNVLTNASDKPWTRQGGLLSLWTLGQFKPLRRGKVIVPFKSGSNKELGPKATTDYFGPIPPDRCQVKDDHLLFACDGQFRGKIGVSPARAKDVLGSFDPEANVLTLAQFNLPPDAARKPYVNSLWKKQKRPFAGDAINSYNDGPPPGGGEMLGGFYELETSSPAAELAPGQSLRHVHRTIHLSGPCEALADLAHPLLGTDLKSI
jgi:hypothetical protein